MRLRGAKVHITPSVVKYHSPTEALKQNISFRFLQFDEQKKIFFKVKGTILVSQAESDRNWQAEVLNPTGAYIRPVTYNW